MSPVSRNLFLTPAKCCSSFALVSGLAPTELMPTERREGGDIPLTPQPAVSSPTAETLISTLSPHSSVVLEPEAQVRDWTETEQRPALTCGLIVERAQQQEQHFYQVGVKISPDMVLYTDSCNKFKTQAAI